jgi:exopolysaccharide biosynthesis protein
LAASLGKVYSSVTDAEPVLYIFRTNQANFNSPRGKVYNAISGNLTLVINGEVASELEGSLEPRTALALDRSGRRLIIVVIDGRQPNYSQGATPSELAEIIIAYDGYNGINLDGGGSATLVIEDEDGKTRILNSPIDNQIPGRERPVGNHLGIFARPLAGNE